MPSLKNYLTRLLAFKDTISGLQNSPRKVLNYLKKDSRRNGAYFKKQHEKKCSTAVQNNVLETISGITKKINVYE